MLWKGIAPAHQKQGYAPYFRPLFRLYPLPPVGQIVKGKPLRGAAHP